MYYNEGPQMNYGWSQHVVEEPTFERRQAQKVEYVSSKKYIDNILGQYPDSFHNKHVW